MSILHLPGLSQFPDDEPQGPISQLIEEQMEDGSVRLVHRLKQENGQSAFISFLADGTFLLRDAYGSSIMTNSAGQMLIRPATALLLKGIEVAVENAETGARTSICPREGQEE